VRIGLVCPYSLDVPGGVQNHVKDLARVLLARGHEVAVLAPGDETAGRPSHIQTISGVVPISFNGAVARVAFGPRVATRTRRWLKDGAFDVVHIHDPATPSVSLLALWASDATVVATFHAANLHSRAMSFVAGALRTSMEKISARIAVSETARSSLVQHIGGEPVVIPNGIFCRDFEDAVLRPEWVDPGPTVAFLGRTGETRKGLAVVMSAFTRVLAAYPGARLLIAGTGRDVLAGMPPSLDGHVQVLGVLSDTERASLLASATVYIAPQLGGESFGVVLVEAMAARAAIVASDLPAFSSVLDHGRLGALFAVGDPEAAARGIVRVLDDPPLRERMRAAAAGAVRRYDWSVVAPQIEAVYDTVARLDPARHAG
jgi:phosphatidyl-myo-inositol alpha-mannosyltransferase